MDLHGDITRSDISQTKEDKCCRSSLICGILKQSRKRLRVIHAENQLVMIARGESRGGMAEWPKGSGRDRLPVTPLISHGEEWDTGGCSQWNYHGVGWGQVEPHP